MSHQVRTAAQRTLESVEGRATRHSFSFGAHYDPDNVGFGPIVCHNDDALAPGAGYPDHAHSDVEIVTWVLDGVLVHTDSLGNHTALTPGTVQVQSAGSGIVHSETADPASGPTRFIQTWLRPDAWDLTPRRLLASLDPAPGLVTAVGGDALPVASAGTQLRVGRVAAGWSGALPQTRGVHLFVATGSLRVELAGGWVDLGPGDAVRLLDEPGARVQAHEAAEVLVWSFA